MAAALFAAILWFSLQSGAVGLTPAQVLDALLGDGSAHSDRVVLNLRLPRIVLGLLIGIHFALSGWLLQLITRNPLAEAGILGISSGASLVVVLAFVAGDLFTTVANPYGGVSVALRWLPLFAMTGGILAAVVVYLLSLRHGQVSPLRITLTGAVVAGMLHALTTGVLAFRGDAHTEVVAQWLAGSLYGAGWDHVLTLWPWTLGGLMTVAMLIRPLRAMQLDDEHARSLGLALQRWRPFALLVAAILAASAVGVVGPVGFLGLLVPHICRRLAGPGLARQCLWCITLGAALTVLADALGRTLVAPYELPVGVVSAALGVPFFLLLLSRQP